MELIDHQHYEDGSTKATIIFEPGDLRKIMNLVSCADPWPIESYQNMDFWFKQLLHQIEGP